MSTVLEAIFESFLENAIIEALAKAAKYTGAGTLRLFNGFKKPLIHYTQKKNFGYTPHIVGLAVIACLIFVLVKLLS